MRKVFSILMVVMLTISFVACANNEQTATPTNGSDITSEAPQSANPTMPSVDVTEDPTEDPTEEPTEEPTEDPSSDLLGIIQMLINEDGTARNGVEDGPEITSHGAAKTVSVDEATGLNVATLTGGTCMYNASLTDYYGDLETAFTLEMYIKIDQFPSGSAGEPYHGVVDNLEAGGFGFDIYPDGTLKFALRLDGAYAYTETKIQSGNWYHIIAVWDGSVVSLYVNGALVTSYDSSYAYIGFPSDESAHYLAIGGCCAAGSHGGLGFKGSIGVCNLYAGAADANYVANAYQELIK